MPYPDIIVSYSDISDVVCMLDRYVTMLTFTEFAAESNGSRPQEDFTFASKQAI